MTLKAFLDENPTPNDEEVRQTLAQNLCRCGSHLRILRAVKSLLKEGS